MTIYVDLPREDPSSCFYVIAAVDMNGDGRICEGDLRIDDARAKHEQT